MVTERTGDAWNTIWGDQAGAANRAVPPTLAAFGRGFAASSVTLHICYPGHRPHLEAAWARPDEPPTEDLRASAWRVALAEQCGGAQAPRLVGTRDGVPGTAIGVPIPAFDGLTAVLSVHRRAATLKQEDLALLSALAGAVSAALASDTALEREAAARERLEALTAIGRVISSSLDIKDAFGQFATETMRLLPHDRLSAHMLVQGGVVDEVFATAGDHTVAAFPPGERRSVSASLPARVVLENLPVLADDLPSDPRFAGNPALVMPRNARAWLSVPLRAGGRVFGALNFSTRTPGSYTEADIPLAQQIADQLATYLDLMHLHQQERAFAVAEERARLARELHDTLSQDLSLLVMQLQALEHARGLPAATRLDVRAAVAQARLSLEEARRSMWDLAPSPLEGRNLAAALDDEIDRFCEVSGARGRLSLIGEARGLDRAVEVAIFRIAQEALSNARKHARAHRVVVALRYDPDAVTMTIEDDGQGFAAGDTGASASGGFGLTSMRERARVLGGALDVSSTPGRGTRVTARLPYRELRVERSQRRISPAHRRAHGTGADAPRAIRVLIADDHTVARQGIRRMLEAHDDIVVVGEAADGRDAVVQAAALRPRVVLLDLQMPHLDGMEALRRLRAEHPTLAVIILTTYAHDERVFAALRDGARGYLLKDTPPEDLAKAIRVVAAGGALVREDVAAGLVNRLQQHDVLTPREIDVLRLVDIGLRGKEIAARLAISIGTVGFHLNNVYRKLDASGRAEALHAARARGLLD